MDPNHPSKKVPQAKSNQVGGCLIDHREEGRRNFFDTATFVQLNPGIAPTARLKREGDVPRTPLPVSINHGINNHGVLQCLLARADAHLSQSMSILSFVSSNPSHRRYSASCSTGLHEAVGLHGSLGRSRSKHTLGDASVIYDCRSG